ncbi:GNAT family N-acetyltransferase [Alicyclobacillus ferrooxydans]|nr:GNAT family N-acetyltransferase [Alicyclobacillus ferrooxydans]
MHIATKTQVVSSNDEQAQLWLTHLWQSEWGGDMMVSHGQVYRLSDLTPIIAKENDTLVGAATYRFDDADGCELMSINAISQGAGIGTLLLKAVEEEAEKHGCRRVWLITSNDNLDALRFYQRRGYRIATIYPGAVDEARRMKPMIPLLGHHGIEIHDEIELVKFFKGTSQRPRLETERLILRPYSKDDLDFFTSLWADREVVRYIGNGITKTPDEAKLRLEQIITGYDTGYGLLAAWHREKHLLVGHAGLVEQHVDGANEIELGYWLARDFWGYGLATEAAAALRDRAFHVLGLERIISIIQADNKASIAVAERVGMELERQTTFKNQSVCIYSMHHSNS